MRFDEVKNKLMQFENKKYCDQIKMVCAKLVEAGFAEKKLIIQGVIVQSIILELTVSLSLSTYSITL